MRNSPDPSPYHLPLLAIGVFCLPIKLSFSYCIFIPLIILHIVDALRGKKPLLGGTAHLAVPLVVYFLALTLLGLAGLNPLKSIPNALSALGMVFLIPLYAGIQGERGTITVLTALIAGQTLAGVHSVLQELEVPIFSSFFVGQVTESGQLALSIPVLFGLIGFLFSGNSRLGNEVTLKSPSPRTQKLLAILVTALLLISCFGEALSLSLTAIVILSSAAALILLASASIIISSQRQHTGKNFPLASALMLWSMPILLTTLIINLKRGPWAGALVGLGIYLSFFRPRTVLPIVAAALLAATTIEPIRSRIMSAPEHFFISGGRSEIWDIGAELISTYPLGIGFKNSSVLGKFSTTVPDNLRHFHSNPINIAVESGMIGLGLFYWWVVTALISAYRKRDQHGHHHPLAIGIACALISWQVAGLVEFNAGDSEVLYISYVLTGLLGALRCKDGRAAMPATAHEPLAVSHAG